jgi:hypothetical protein
MEFIEVRYNCSVERRAPVTDEMNERNTRDLLGPGTPSPPRPPLMKKLGGLAQRKKRAGSLPIPKAEGEQNKKLFPEGCIIQP